VQDEATKLVSKLRDAAASADDATCADLRTTANFVRYASVAFAHAIALTASRY
jgi:hypothetical protein